MNRYIVLIISLFTLTNLYSMGNGTTSQEAIYDHNRLSKKASVLIHSEINEATITQWKELLEEAHKFKDNNPQFPYLRLARRPGQGPDAQSIISTVPLVIDLLEDKCLEGNKLKKISRNFGRHYILKLLAVPKK